MNDKLCLWCKHFELVAGTPDLSEVTPGDCASIMCNAGGGTPWWRVEEPTTDQFRATTLNALRCDKFELADVMRKLTVM